MGSHLSPPRPPSLYVSRIPQDVSRMLTTVGSTTDTSQPTDATDDTDGVDVGVLDGGGVLAGG